MTQENMIEILADVLDIDADQLAPGTELAGLDEWDSLSALSLIVTADEKWGKKLTGEQVRSFVTVQDILDFLG